MMAFVDEVEESTGTLIPYEIFRKFYNGVRRSDGSYRLQSPEDSKHLEAIVNFLSEAEELPAFTADKLSGMNPRLSAPAHLKTYLESSNTNERLAAPHNLEGCFVNLRIENKRTTKTSLFLSNLTNFGIGEARLIREGFYTESKMRAEGELDGSVPDKITTFSGWVIISPEDNLLIFTKSDVTGRNVHHLSLGFNGNVFDSEPLELVAFWEQELPHEFDPNGLSAPREQMLEEIGKFALTCILVFERM